MSALHRLELRNNGFTIPCMGSDGVWIDKAMVEDVYQRLRKLEADYDSQPALDVLYRASMAAACRFKLYSEKSPTTYKIVDDYVVFLLRKHRILVGDEIEPKLVIVFNCLKKFTEDGKVHLFYPIKLDLQRII